MPGTTTGAAEHICMERRTKASSYSGAWRGVARRVIGLHHAEQEAVVVARIRPGATLGAGNGKYCIES